MTTTEQAPTGTDGQAQGTEDAARAAMDDLATIAPTEGPVTIAGVPCMVRRVRTRELMLLVRVLTAGFGPGLSAIDFKGSESDWGPQLAGLMVMAIPEAHDEFLDLLRALVEPENTLDDEARTAFDAEIRNPDIDTSMDVIATIAAQERDTFPALLGKAKLLVGQVTALYRTGKKDS